MNESLKRPISKGYPGGDSDLGKDGTVSVGPSVTAPVDWTPKNG